MSDLQASSHGTFQSRINSESEWGLLSIFLWTEKVWLLGIPWSCFKAMYQTNNQSKARRHFISSKSIVVTLWHTTDGGILQWLCWHHSVLYYWWRTLLLVLITDGLMVIILPFAIHSMPRIFLKCNSKLDTCIFKALQGLPHAPQNKAQRSQSAIFKGCSDLPWTSLSDTLPGRCFQTTSGTSLASLLTTHTLCFSYLLC